MPESLPLIQSSIFLILILFLIHSIFRYLQIKEETSFEKISIIVHEYSILKITHFIIAGFAIISGINFILLSNFLQPYPQDLQIQESDVLMLILGGIIVIIASLYSIFSDVIYDKNSVAIGKNRISPKKIDLYREYSHYKKMTDNPPLQVVKFFDDKKGETFLVDTLKGNDFLTKNLQFDLFYEESISINNSPFQTGSLEIAECVLFRRGEKHAHFKILKWFITKSNREIINKLKTNQNLDGLKPFIKLRDHPIADQFTFSELENLTKTLSKLKRILEED